MYAVAIRCYYCSMHLCLCLSRINWPSFCSTDSSVPSCFVVCIDWPILFFVIVRMLQATLYGCFANCFDWPMSIFVWVERASVSSVVSIDWPINYSYDAGVPIWMARDASTNDILCLHDAIVSVCVPSYESTDWFCLSCLVCLYVLCHMHRLTDFIILMMLACHFVWFCFYVFRVALCLFCHTHRLAAFFFRVMPAWLYVGFVICIKWPKLCFEWCSLLSQILSHNSFSGGFVACLLLVFYHM